MESLSDSPSTQPATIRLAVLLGTMMLMFAVLITYAFNNPLASYYGRVLPKPVLAKQSEHPTYCQMVSPLPIGVQFVCFDSKGELDAYANRR